MPKATKTKKEQAPPVSLAPKVIYEGMVNLTSIEARGNIRKRFDEASLKDLADNIRQWGVQTPLWLRPNPTPGGLGHLLIAGERRLRAARMAGLKQVPARVYEADDDTARAMQALENLQRQDLTPMEEARGFAALRGSMSAAQLAAKVNKSESYVYKRLGLVELPEDVQTAIEDGKATVQAGYQLLRVPAGLRQKVWEKFTQTYDYENGNATGDVMAVFIEHEFGRELERAWFDPAVVEAEYFDCASCASNSANQGALFDGEVRGGKCTNGACFDAKNKHALEGLVVQAQKDYPRLDYVGHLGANQWSPRKIEKNAKAVTDADLKTKAVAKLIAAQPDQFVLASFGDSWNKPQILVLARDQKLVDKALGRKPPEGCASIIKKSARDTFIETRTEMAVLKEAARIAGEGPIAVEVLAPIVERAVGGSRALNEEDAAEVLGMALPEDQEGYQALGVSKLLALGFVAAVYDYVGLDEEALKAAGVDVARVKADAQRIAAAEWKAREKGGKAGE